MSPVGSVPCRNTHTLFHHGFFRKYAITREEEKRRSKQNSPAPTKSRQSTTPSRSLSPPKSTIITPPNMAPSLPTTNTLAARSPSFHGCIQSSSEDGIPRSSHESPSRNSSQRQCPNTNQSKFTSNEGISNPDTAAQSETSETKRSSDLENVGCDVRSLENARLLQKFQAQRRPSSIPTELGQRQQPGPKPSIEPRSTDAFAEPPPPSSSALSPPPESTPTSVRFSSCELSSYGSRKRKRTPIGEELDNIVRSRTSSIPQPVASKDSGIISISVADNASNARSPPSSPLSTLSQSPVPPTQFGRKSNHEQFSTSQNPPTSSITTLSETPVSPKGNTNLSRRSVGDSQDSEDMSDGIVYEEEIQQDRPTSTTSTFCVNESSDSDSDLAPLDELLLPSRKTSTDPEAGFKRETRSRTEKQRNTLSGKQEPVKRDSKYSLTKLVEDSFRDKTRLQQLKDMEAEIDAAETKELENAKSALGGDTSLIDPSAFSSLIDDDDDQDRTERLQLAIKRQDMLHRDVVWHAFTDQDRCADPDYPDFPIAAVEKLPKLSKLAEPLFREQAFLTGFASEWLGSCETIPGGLMNWLWKASIYEPRNDLRHAYGCTLKECAQHLTQYINFPFLSRPLQGMGTRRDALNPIKPIEHTTQPIKEAPKKPPMLLHRFIRSLHFIGSAIPASLLPGVIGVLLRLGIDRCVSENLDVLPDLTALLTQLIKASHASNREHPLAGIEGDFPGTIVHPVLQKRLLSLVSDNSIECYLFKRRLALAFFLSSPSWLADPLQNTELLTRRITRHISSSDKFDPLQEELDYRCLNASIHILNIAIGPGFRASDLLKSDATEDNLQEKKEEEKRFNIQVDKLSSTINSLYTRVQDTGASHMLRTTAKSSIHNLQFRLDYAVRTKPKPRKDVLGSSMSDNRKLSFVPKPVRRASLGSDRSTDLKKRKVTFKVSEDSVIAEREKSGLDGFWNQKSATASTE